MALIDPKNFFIKSEPHAGKKVKTERWRLIWIQSYVDSTIQRLLHGAQNSIDVLRYHAGLSTCATIGLGHDDGGIDAFGPHFDKLKAMTDASGWDLSVSADSLWQVNGQIECQKICQIECQKVCQIECQIKCQIECQKICQQQNV